MPDFLERFLELIDRLDRVRIDGAAGCGCPEHRWQTRRYGALFFGPRMRKRMLFERGLFGAGAVFRELDSDSADGAFISLTKTDAID